MKKIVFFFGSWLWPCLLFGQCGLDQTNFAGSYFAPSFWQFPSNITVISGSTATFSSQACGDPDPSYLWTLNGRVLRFGPTLTLSNVHHTDAGVYSVIALNSQGLDGPYSATLTVLPRSQLIQNTQPGNGIVGVPFQLVASADSGLPITYRVWLGPATVSASGLVTPTAPGEVYIILSQVGDADWRSAATTISFSVLDPTPSLTQPVIIEGHLRIVVGGLTGQTYEVQSSPTPNGTWTTEATNTINAYGEWIYQPALAPGSRFFRAHFVP